jgi:hypothetical protein
MEFASWSNAGLSPGKITLRCHLKDDAAVIGMNDFDVNPPDLARSYVLDDARIYSYEMNKHCPIPRNSSVREQR